MSTPRCFLAVICVVPLVACAGVTAHDETYASHSENALTTNRLAYNRLAYNRLAYNRLAYNSLDSDFHETEEGLELLRYIVRCALDEGDVLIVESGGETVELPGSLGLAPSWAEKPLSQSGQERVSGCLIAHANAFGVRVPISVRYPGWLETSDEEEKAFTLHEGAFFGNLFDPDSGPIHSCFCGEAPDNSERLDVGAGDRLLRLCADESCGPIESLGDCADVCSGTGLSNCGGDEGGRFIATHAWLLSPSAVDAAWRKNIELLEDHYGVAHEPVEPPPADSPISKAEMKAKTVKTR